MCRQWHGDGNDDDDDKPRKMTDASLILYKTNERSVTLKMDGATTM